ncbi:MAG: hypothetical protein JW973_16135 [Bacteroidales bacterium]|nr:hypothetical protein [Bacteroidales bacterium]
MNTIQSLEFDAFFHIYNRDINGETLFKEDSNYEYFLRLYNEYINPIGDTYAWCLLKNHFHMLVYIKPEADIEFMKPKENDKRVFKQMKKYNPTRQFANLFDAYAKAFNKKYKRTGGLFETPFRRINIGNDNYFRELVFYIHNNPVKHGFVNEISDYPWSSYSYITSDKLNGIVCKEVLNWFNSVSEFIEFHNLKTEIKNIQEFDLED